MPMTACNQMQVAFHQEHGRCNVTSFSVCSVSAYSVNNSFVALLLNANSSKVIVRICVKTVT